MIKKTYTLKKQGSFTIGELREFCNATDSLPDNTIVSITKYNGDQRDPSETTLSVTEP